MLFQHIDDSDASAWTADGLAVGAAVHGGNAQISAAVALAMIMHKAPAALGLTTFLIAARRVNQRHNLAAICSLFCYQGLQIEP